MAIFRRYVARQTGEALPDYEALQAFALARPMMFWPLLLEWLGIPMSGATTPAIEGAEIESASFFPGVRLNWAEALVVGGDDQAIAIRSIDEAGHETTLTRRELRTQVEELAQGLRARGIGSSSRAVAIVRNDAQAAIACLATAAVGATWSSIGTEVGSEAITARFAQLSPDVLFICGSTQLQGVARDLVPLVQRVASTLPSLALVVALDAAAHAAQTTPAPVAIADLVQPGPPFTWERFPFSHPLFVLFSSGTTGVPKCIVHGHGGTLLEHVKELRLHTDLSASDRLCFITNAGWMMWNWQLSALACHAEVVLYDGSVSHPEPDSLLRAIDTAGVTVFGLSPAYLQYLRERAISPRTRFGLRALRGLLSTGSILPDAAYDWCAAHFGPIPLQSVSGGTDIIGCFVLGNPELPVYRGESQCVSLGLDVRAMVNGANVREGTGELICAAPFPSRPVAFLGADAERRFHDAYFSQNPGVWTHGDLVELTSRGTARILGRTDGTLNIRGVRIGPAEIYAIVMQVPGVTGALAVEQRAPREPGGSRLVLLLTMDADTPLSRPLEHQIKRQLRDQASANHVPGVIAQVPGLPSTYNGKLSERAARDAVNGVVPENVQALRNPDTIDAIATHPAIVLPREEPA
jgi:acetoacetyl-CoA synthetase